MNILKDKDDDLDSHIICIEELGYLRLLYAVEFGRTRSLIGFYINNMSIPQVVSGFDNTL